LLFIRQQRLQAVVVNVSAQLGCVQIGFDPGFEILVALFLLLPTNPYLKIFLFYILQRCPTLKLVFVWVLLINGRCVRSAIAQQCHLFFI